jgi:hypothetical protein
MKNRGVTFVLVGLAAIAAATLGCQTQKTQAACYPTGACTSD